MKSYSDGVSDLQTWAFMPPTHPPGRVKKEITKLWVDDISILTPLAFYDRGVKNLILMHIHSKNKLGFFLAMNTFRFVFHLYISVISLVYFVFSTQKLLHYTLPQNYLEVTHLLQ